MSNTSSKCCISSKLYENKTSSTHSSIHNFWAIPSNNIKQCGGEWAPLIEPHVAQFQLAPTFLIQSCYNSIYSSGIMISIILFQSSLIRILCQWTSWSLQNNNVAFALIVDFLPWSLVCDWIIYSLLFWSKSCLPKRSFVIKFNPFTNFVLHDSAIYLDHNWTA